jgi:hypothetical protein
MLLLDQDQTRFAVVRASLHPQNLEIGHVQGANLFWTHSGYVIATVPYVFLLGCPLMHLSGRRHHHGQKGHRS